MPQLTLRLELLRIAVKVTVSDDADEITHLGTALSDAPGELAWEMATLLEGASEVRVPWQEEPGQYRWVMRRSGDRVELRVLWFDDTFSRRTDDEGKLLFRAECDVLRLATQVKGALHQLLNALGPEGYARQWHSRFPAADFERLTASIQAAKAARRASE